MKKILYYFYTPLLFVSLYIGFRYTSMFTITALALVYGLCAQNFKKEIIEKEKVKIEKLEELLKKITEENTEEEKLEELWNNIKINTTLKKVVFFDDLKKRNN